MTERLLSTPFELAKSKESKAVEAWKKADFKNPRLVAFYKRYVEDIFEQKEKGDENYNAETIHEGTLIRFLQNVQATGREDVMRQFVRMREDINAGRQLSNEDAVLIQKYQLKHLRNADLNGVEFRGGLYHMDLRHSSLSNVTVHGSIHGGKFDSIVASTIHGSVEGVFVNHSIQNNSIRGSISACTADYICQNTVGDDIEDNSVGVISKNIARDICENTAQEIKDNKVQDVSIKTPDEDLERKNKAGTVRWNTRA